MSLKRINKKHQRIIYTAAMAAMMSLAITFSLTILNFGLKQGFVDRWAHSFLVSISISFPTALLASGMAMRITDKITTKNSN